MVRKMSSNGVFESKSGRSERGTIWQNIVDNLEVLEIILLPL